MELSLRILSAAVHAWYMPLTDEGLMRVPGLASRWVRLGDGSKAHYVTSGDEGPAVILLHGGIPGSSGTAGFRFMAPFLGQHGFRVYCPDQPGFGLSDTRLEYHPHQGIMSHVDFLNRFADAICVDEFFLAGNSMGCMNAAHYAVRYPHRVLGVALIAGFIGDLYPVDIPSVLRIPVDQGNDMSTMMTSIIRNKDAVSADLVAMRSRAADRNEAAWLVWQSTVQRAEVSADNARAMSTTGRLDKLDIPGIYLYGADDVLLPADPIGYDQEDLLPNFQFFYVPDCGHQGQTDQPELFNQVLLEFFRDGYVSRRTADLAGVSTRRPELPAIVEPRSDALAASGIDASAAIREV